jgi:hypothetical protein
VGRCDEGPLHVRCGVAVLEESVELGVPDIITQLEESQTLDTEQAEDGG